MADELDAVLRGTFPLEERLAEQARAYAEGRRPVSPVPSTPDVTIDNEASAESTVIEVRAEDAVGLLHRVTAALFALDLDVVAARVSTGRRGLRRLLRPRPGHRRKDQRSERIGQIETKSDGHQADVTGADLSLLFPAGHRSIPQISPFPARPTSPVTGRWYHLR